MAMVMPLDYKYIGKTPQIMNELQPHPLRTHFLSALSQYFSVIPDLIILTGISSMLSFQMLWI
jgi:hypothetical protein